MSQLCDWEELDSNRRLYRYLLVETCSLRAFKHESGIYSDPQTERTVQRFGSFELEYKNRILSSSLEQDFELSND